ncbi:MAG: Omp28-related outer membrane protein, partial [Flavobacteriales bacterium]
MSRSYFIWIVALVLSLVSCEEEENPLIEFGNAYREDLYGPPPVFGPSGPAHQRVLLEDFTGHDCGNCPNGHVVAHDLLDAHADDIAVVAIHAGSLAAPFPPDFPNDWTTTEGEYYLLTQVGVDVMPKGRVNRNPGASTTFNPSGWSAQFDLAAQSTPPVNLQLQTSYSSTNEHLNIHIQEDWKSDFSGDAHLVVLITESDIVAPQLWYGQTPEYIPDYAHGHMLRASATGSTGLVSSSNPAAGLM